MSCWGGRNCMAPDFDESTVAAFQAVVSRRAATSRVSMKTVFTRAIFTTMLA